MILHLRVRLTGGDERLTIYRTINKLGKISPPAQVFGEAEKLIARLLQTDSSASSTILPNGNHASSIPAIANNTFYPLKIYPVIVYISQPMAI